MRWAAGSADRPITTATIDHDGTIIEAHKHDALVAYEGTRGYQPLVAVWAEQQLVVADEFRDGNAAGGRAPARRVGFFLHNDTAIVLNKQGWRLFDAAVRWCAEDSGPRPQ